MYFYSRINFFGRADPLCRPKLGGKFSPNFGYSRCQSAKFLRPTLKFSRMYFYSRINFFVPATPKICGFGRAGQRFFFFCDSGQLEQFDAGNQSGGWSACWKSAITSLSLALFGSMVTCFCPPLRFIYTLNGHDAGFPTPTWASRVKKPRDCRPNFGQHRTPTVKKKLSRL